MKIKGTPVTPEMTARQLVQSFASVGFQASELNRAAGVLNAMTADKATVFLAFTSNLASSGLREHIAQLCREKRVHAIITGVGSMEEDLMKATGGFELASFSEDDAKLRKQGANRIGNILAPNTLYEKLEKTLKPFFGRMLEENEGKPLAPSEMFAQLGRAVSDENSFLHWASRNGIPVFCPAPTDGAFGLNALYFKQDHPNFTIDVVGDLQRLATLTLATKKTGALVLGGGFAKHHAIGINLIRGGLDYAVYVTTATEFDGSLSGARCREAVSWGKIKPGARTAYVQCDATIALPLLMAAWE